MRFKAVRAQGVHETAPEASSPLRGKESSQGQKNTMGFH